MKVHIIEFVLHNRKNDIYFFYNTPVEMPNYSTETIDYDPIEDDLRQENMNDDEAMLSYPAAAAPPAYSDYSAGGGSSGTSRTTCFNVISLFLIILLSFLFKYI